MTVGLRSHRVALHRDGITVEPREHSDYVRRPRFRVALVLVAATGATVASASPYPARPAAIHEADGCRRAAEPHKSRKRGRCATRWTGPTSATCRSRPPRQAARVAPDFQIHGEGKRVVSASPSEQGQVSDQRIRKRSAALPHEVPQHAVRHQRRRVARSARQPVRAPWRHGCPVDSEPIDSLIRVVTTSARRLTLSGCVAGALMQASGCGRGTGSRRASGSQRPAPCVLTM